MADRDSKIEAVQPAPGAARSHGISWEALMAQDSRPVPEFLATESYAHRGSAPVATSRYTSAEFAALEEAKMWPHVWQFAARVEDMPEAGDFVVYENAGRTYIISRQDDGSLKAFHNVCLHRGRKLRTEGGCADTFQCPFHGFAWNKDGTLANIPSRWDFPHLNADNSSLPQAEVDSWGGYIFIRETPGGPSLAEFLAPLPDHFARWRHEDCTTAIWVAKVIPANWKAVMEAFMESWHSVVTHPQILPFTGDENAAYWTWGDNVSVNLVPFGVMSPHLDGNGKPEQWIVDQFIKFNGRSAENYAASDNAFAVTVPSDQTARVALGAAMRASYAASSGMDHDHATDAELLDALVYNVFPNWAPWGGFMPNIVYRFRPGADVDHCLMEVRILTRVPVGTTPPRGAPMRLLGPDEPWTNAAELGVLADVFEQDMQNLPYVQQGMKMSKTGTLQLADYQEIRLRQFQQTLDGYLAR